MNSDFFLLLFAFPFGIGTFTIALVALSTAQQAKQRATALEAELAVLSRELLSLRHTLATSPIMPTGAPDASQGPPQTSSHSPFGEPARSEIPTARPTQDAPIADPPRTMPIPGVPVPHQAAPGVAGLFPPPRYPNSPLSVHTSAPASPLPETKRAGTISDKADHTTSLEAHIGVTWLTRIGAAIFILGAAYFLKYAADNEWIGPLGRVALGILIGIVFLAFAEHQRPLATPRFVHALLGVGLAVLLASTYASFAFYHLVPLAVAFAGVALISIVGGALALRYHAQIVLVIALGAALTNPVIFSTGKDHPLGLFGYLFLVTTGAFVVAVRAGFGAPLWLSIGGTSALWLGWYSHCFDNHPPAPAPRLDAPLAYSEGHYYLLSARIIPILFVLLFSIQWVFLAEAARARRVRHASPAGLLVAGLVFAHGGLGGLLYDQALVLGITMLILSALSIGLLWRISRTELLLAPLGASFLVLISAVHQGRTMPFTYLAMIAVWASVYSIAIFQEQIRRRSHKLPAGRTLLLLGTVLFAVMVIAGGLLLPDHFGSFGITVAILSALACGLATVAERGAAWGFLACLITLLALLIGSASLNDGVRQPTYMIVGALWAIVYWIFSIRKTITSPLNANSLFLLIASLSGIGFLVLAFIHAPPHASTLRALLVMAVAVTNFGFGVMLRRRRKERYVGDVMLGQALCGFVGCLTLVHSGATLTVLWAALAAIVLVIAASTKQTRWLGAGFVLMMLIVIRISVFDMWIPHRQTSLFEMSLGHEGALVPRLLWNPRTLSLIAFSTALLVSAKSAARVKTRLWNACALTLASLGYSVLCLVSTLEVHRAFTSSPASPPASIDAQEFNVYMQSVRELFALQENRLAMLTTLVIGLMAVALLVAGFAAPSAYHRYLGLSALSLTLSKLLLWDVWYLTRVYQIIVLIAVGAMLLSAGFLYARFGKRLLTILRRGSIATGLLIFFALLSAQPRTAQALETRLYRHIAPLSGIDTAGYFAVDIDPVLYRASSSVTPLSDIRIATASGEEIPFLIRPVSAPANVSELTATTLDPIHLPDGSERITFDLEQPGNLHNEIVLQLEGNPFLRSTQIEVSEDGQSFGVIARGDLVYRLTDTQSGILKEGTILHYPLSRARFVRILVLSGEGNPHIISGKVQLDHTPTAEARAWIPLTMEPPFTDEKTHITEVILDAGEPGVPVQGLALEIANSEFDRRCTVYATNYRQYWPAIGVGELYRAAGHENLTLQLAPTRKRWFKVHIDNGDSSPLELSATKAYYHREQIVFHAPRAGDVFLYIGNPNAQTPHYDMADVLTRSGGEVSVRPATLGLLTANRALSDSIEQPHLPFTEKHRKPIGIALATIALALSVWTWRLLRKPVEFT